MFSFQCIDLSSTCKEPYLIRDFQGLYQSHKELFHLKILFIEILNSDINKALSYIVETIKHWNIFSLSTSLFSSRPPLLLAPRPPPPSAAAGRKSGSRPRVSCSSGAAPCSPTPSACPRTPPSAPAGWRPATAGRSPGWTVRALKSETYSRSL